jgi:sugar lactone lactonase YvrE
MAVDEQGNLYVAYFDTGEVVVFTGKGKLIGAIKLPAGEGTFAANVILGSRTARPSTLPIRPHSCPESS